MKKTVLTFGLISGVMSTLMMVATVPFADRIGFERSAVVGYTTIVLSFLLVFFGIRSDRDNLGNGLAITLISAAVLKRKPQAQPARSPLPAAS